MHLSMTIQVPSLLDLLAYQDTYGYISYRLQGHKNTHRGCQSMQDLSRKSSSSVAFWSCLPTLTWGQQRRGLWQYPICYWHGVATGIRWTCLALLQSHMLECVAACLSMWLMVISHVRSYWTVISDIGYHVTAVEGALWSCGSMMLWVVSHWVNLWCWLWFPCRHHLKCWQRRTEFSCRLTCL